jgi:hypothetical protein
MLRQVLGSAVILFSPLPVHSLSKILCVTKEDVNLALLDLHSVLHIPKDPTCPIRLHHPSFRDFLLNEDRCNDPNFWVDEKQAHQTLADSCIQLMSQTLNKDVCELQAPGSQAKLRAVGLRDVFRPKFNMHAFTGSIICKGVALRFTMTRKLTDFCRLIYYTGLRRLGGWARPQKGFKQYSIIYKG